MKKLIQLMKASFESSERIPVFEFEVIDNKTKETDFITFDISIERNSLIAKHIALTYQEEKSSKVAFKAIEIDTCFTLDENLQSLYEICNNAIYESELFSPIN